MPSRRAIFAGLALAVALVAVAPVSAQASSGDLVNPEFDALNPAYAVYLGSGVYWSNGRSLFVIRVFPKFRVRSEEEHAFGVRIRLNATFGFYDVRDDDFPDFDVDRIRTFALVPGIEFPIKLYDNWTLMPFLDFGASIDSEFDETTLVHGVGARSRAFFEDERYLYVLWNELIAAGNSSTDFSPQDNYTVFRTDFEMRGIVDYRLFNRDFDLGFLAAADIFFDPLIIEEPIVGTPEEVDWILELGLTTGATKRWKQLKNLVTTPRLGLSYRWGRDFSAVRFVIRFRY